MVDFSALKTAINGLRNWAEGRFAKLFIPDKTSQLENDAGYLTDQDLGEYATKADIAALGNVLSFKGSLATVDDLPASGNTLGDVYYIAADSSGYVWMQDANGVERWEQLGPMVDMTNYAEITQSDVDELAALLE